MRLADAAGFMFDLDGTLVERAEDGLRVLPGARETLAAIRASGRPLVIFTNASDSAPAAIAARARGAGLELADDEVLTAACSAIGHLRRRHPGARVHVLATPATAARIAQAGFELTGGEGADVVLALHVNEVALEELEHAARAVMAGAAFLIANYAPAYAGLGGPIISRGAMIAAAIAKASGRRPSIVGKPSRAAVAEVAERLQLDPRTVAFVGDDLGMDVALGRLAGGATVLVRTGMSGGDVDGVAPARRPDLVLDGVGDLVDLI